jgi:regulator of protease activity HflC (stomatin/prohibitin superfamily)
MMLPILLSLITTVASFSIFFSIKSQGDNPKNTGVRALSFLVGLLALGYLLWGGLRRFWIVIPVGEVGIVETLGNIEPKSLDPGVHFLNPFTDELITFSTRLQDIKETVDTTSKEGLSFKLDVSLQYRIEPSKAQEIYQKLGSNEEEIIISRFRALIRQVTASYNLQDIYSEKRSAIARTLYKTMNEQLNPLGFVVEETLLRNIILPDNIQAAIQSKVALEQENQKLDLEIAKARKEAERKKVEAQGISASQKILSDGLTDKILKLKAIEAQQKLAESPNSKIIIMGNSQGNTSLILSNDK